MTPKLKLLAGSMLMASFVLSPVISSANQGRNEEKHAIKTEIKINKEDRNEKNCLQVFAHLARGKDWKNQNNLSLNDCWLPFGIAKKLKNPNASTTIDTTIPVISNLIVTPEAQKAKVTWTTSEKTYGEIFLSTSTPVSLTGASVIKPRWFDGMEKEHSFVLSKLSSNTTYYLIVRSKDRAGNTATSSQVSFTTLSLPADITSPVISDVVTIKATSTIQVAWKTNELSKSVLYYGTSTPVNINATSTSRISDNSFQLNHVLTVPNLNPNTNYYLLIEVTDENNNKTVSSQFTVTTNL